MKEGNVMESNFFRLKNIFKLAIINIGVFMVVFLQKDMCMASSLVVPEGYKAIYTVDDLYGINDDLDGKYILMNDLDLSETKQGGELDDGYGWTPIGAYEVSDKDDYIDISKCAFGGVFDGNGYRIKNMTIYGSKICPNYLGLFTLIGQDGVVKNLALENVSISMGKYSSTSIGGIAGYNNGCINSSYVTGNIYTLYGHNVGGLVGISNSDISRSKISNCYSDVNIELQGESNIFTGGIVGHNISGEIVNCYAIGMIQLSDSEKDMSLKCIGAIAGYDDDETDAVGWDLGEKNCYYMGTLSDLCAKRMTKNQMKKKQYFTGFDFKKKWIIDSNSIYAYPQLRTCRQVRTESIELISMPNKLCYYTSDKLDLSGAELQINYENDRSVIVPLTEEILSYKMQEGMQVVNINYNDCTAEFNIEVKKTVESLKFVKKKTKLKVGDIFTFKIKYVGDGTVSYLSSNSSIIKINSKTGKVKAKKAGTANITVKAGNLIRKVKVKVVK